MTPAPLWRRAELSYCSNVHPGETLAAVRTVIATHTAAVRRLRSLSRMGGGLWLSARAAGEMQTPAARRAFSDCLADHAIELLTLNGFPFGDFHAAAVKEQVYQPDWTRPERLAYTRQLALILADCLPSEQAEGTISTVPLGYRVGWTAARRQTAVTALCRLAGCLAELRERSGRQIRVCLEMEPGCALESVAELLALFAQDLPAAAQRQGVPWENIEQHLGVCFDVCHQAVMFEAPGESLARLHRAGVAIGKIQLSSALEILHPADPAAQAALREFAEPRYFHQTRTRVDNQTLGVMDLPHALESPGLPTLSPWRVHFHTPVQATTLASPALTTTQAAIGQTLDFLAQNRAVHPQLEVETYTWQVLPPALRPRDDAELQQGLAAELAWVEEQMQRRGLLAP